jgi:hypothetical protein
MPSNSLSKGSTIAAPLLAKAFTGTVSHRCSAQTFKPLKS